MSSIVVRCSHVHFYNIKAPGRVSEVAAEATTAIGATAEAQTGRLPEKEHAKRKNDDVIIHRGLSSTFTNAFILVIGCIHTFAYSADKKHSMLDVHKT